MMKYKTLADLVNAYHAKELTRETAMLTIDNDNVHVTFHAADDPDWLRAENVFEMDPLDLLEQALDLLGIPHEHV